MRGVGRHRSRPTLPTAAAKTPVAAPIGSAATFLRCGRSDGAPRVSILPAQPRERVPALLAAADIALISLGRTLPGAVPSKIYEAMASALPILLIAGGEPAARVTRAPSGVAVAPGDPEAFAGAWRQLVTDPALRQSLGDAGRHEAEVRYSRAAIADRLDTVLRQALAPTATPPQPSNR